MTRILLVDDHGMLRELIRGLLESEPGLTIVGEAEDGRKGLQLAEAQKPDLVISDFRMQEMNGLEMIREIHSFSPGTRIIIHSMLEDPACVAMAMEAGASGYVLKGSSFDDLLMAIHMAISGQHYISPSLVDHKPQARSIS